MARRWKGAVLPLAGWKSHGCVNQGGCQTRSWFAADTVPGESDPLYPDLGTSYDVTRDGKRFVINTALDNGRDPPIMVIVNWAAQVR